MKRISMRSWAIWVLILLLLVGTGIFVTEYLLQGEAWAMYPDNSHIYTPGTGTPASGTVVDAQGNMLLSFGTNRSYSADASVRQATLHWLGDREGYIHAPMLKNCTPYLTDYNAVDGLYNYAGQGGTVQLTMSSYVQKVALEAMGSHKGTVAVFNYKTGEILCAVSTPTYDPDSVPEIAGDTSGKYDGVYLNRFTQSVFIPGSIFKIVTTAAALEQVEDIEKFSYTCTGTYRFGVDKVTCVEAHGKLNLKEAMLESCNCFYAGLALKIGSAGLQDYVERSGVLDSMTFDSVTTAKGNIHLLGAADVELAWSAIGQHDDQINPCSFLAFVGAIANEGQGIQPYMVSSVTLNGEKTYTAAHRRMEPVLSAKAAATLRSYMRNNVENYYGDSHFPGLTVCAKSGTAEVGGNALPNAMFTGFAMDEDYPLAFMVAVENGGYGQTTCIPILQPVLQACKEIMDA